MTIVFITVQASSSIYAEGTCADRDEMKKKVILMKGKYELTLMRSDLGPIIPKIPILVHLW